MGGLVSRIDALLPRTQCTRCGYEGCRPYAQAIADDGAPINRCPPGGTATLQALAQLLGREAGELDPSCGAPGDPGVAWIDAGACIGCARCLPPCPVDAIIGASRYLHTVQATRCTGCELCIASCPVDCIRMRPREPQQGAPHSADNRRHHEQHLARAAARAAAREALLADRKRPAT